MVGGTLYHQEDPEEVSLSSRCHYSPEARFIILLKQAIYIMYKATTKEKDGGFSMLFWGVT